MAWVMNSIVTLPLSWLMVGGEVFGGGAVQTAGRFIKQQYLGLFDQCPCDCKALLSVHPTIPPLVRRSRSG